MPRKTCIVGLLTIAIIVVVQVVGVSQSKPNSDGRDPNPPSDFRIQCAATPAPNEVLRIASQAPVTAKAWMHRVLATAGRNTSTKPDLKIVNRGKADFDKQGYSVNIRFSKEM